MGQLILRRCITSDGYVGIVTGQFPEQPTSEIRFSPPDPTQKGELILVNVLSAILEMY